MTASAFGQATGIAPGSRAQLWRRLRGLETFEGNEATQWGDDHESEAITRFESMLGRLVIPTGFHVHPDYEWLGCSPDGLIDDESIVEVKCPFSQTHYPSIPPYYMAQMQGQMEITNRQRCAFVCWTPDGLKVSWVRRSPEYWEWMFPRLAEFWSFVLSGNEPPRFKKKPVAPDLDLVEAEQVLLF